MFLSNPRNFLLVVFLFSNIFQGCGSGAANNAGTNAAGIEKKSEFPFSTAEPNIYQGEFVVTAAGTEDKWFIARNGERRRFDILKDGKPFISQIKSDALYFVDHAKKAYAVRPLSGLMMNIALDSFYRGKEYRKFEDLGTENGLKKYRATTSDQGKGTILIFVDESNGMMVRQEFTDGGETNAAGPNSFVYEIRDLKLEANDSVFAIPSGYRKVSWEEFRSFGSKAEPAAK